jgi:hypothetical protein
VLGPPRTNVLTEEEKAEREAERKKKEEEKKAEEAKKEKMRAAMRAKLVGKSVGFHTKVPDNYDKRINYVIQAGGLFEVRVNPIGHFTRKPKLVVGGESKLRCGFTYKLARKIPIALLHYTIMFFKKINKLYSSEAYVQYYWDKENEQFLINFPIQDATGAHVNYTRDEELEGRYLLVADVHSHNTMTAHFSAVDDGDEKENRIFGVIGEITKDIPAMKFRIATGGEHIDLRPSDIFDLNTNDDELKKLSEAVGNMTAGATTTSYSYSGGYGAWHGGGRSGGYTQSSDSSPALSEVIDDDQVGFIEDPNDVDAVFDGIIKDWDESAVIELVDLLIVAGYEETIISRIDGDIVEGEEVGEEAGEESEEEERVVEVDQGAEEEIFGGEENDDGKLEVEIIGEESE